MRTVVLLASVLLVSCSVEWGDHLERTINLYCDTPEQARSIVRKAINFRLAPHSITIQCNNG